MKDAAETILDILENSTEDQFAILDRKLIQSEPKADVSNETIQAVASRAEAPFADDQTIQAIKEVRAKWKHAWDSVLFHSDTQNAKAAWLKHKQGLAGKIAEGKTLDNSDGWSREDWESDFFNKRESSKLAGEKFCKEAIELAKAPVAKFIRFCNQLADEIQGGERALSQEFAVTYQPSNIVHTIRATGNAARIKLPSVAQWGSDPDKFMVFLPLE